jgi:hypothetical protein
MLYRLGRLLQLAGLIVLPIAIAGNLVPEKPLTLWQSLSLSALGITLFYLGRWLQESGKSP